MGGVLVIPAKAKVVLKKSKGGKRRAEPGTAKRGMAELDKNQRKHNRALTTLKIIQG